MIKKLSLILLLIITNTSVALAQDQKTIVLLGDSLSAGYGMQEKDGWVALLNKQLNLQKSGYQILNASISGETTGGGLARLPEILESNKVDYLLVELGGNDGLQGFPPKLIKNNLLQIIGLAQQKNITVFLSEIKIPPNYGERYNQMFADVFVSVATETKVELLPFFIESVAVDPDKMQNDGIHPNKAAQAELAGIMKNIIDNAIKNSNNTVISTEKNSAKNNSVKNSANN